MAWNRLGGGSASSSGTVATTTAINATGADLVVVVVSEYSGNALGSISDSSSNTWGANSVTTTNSNGVRCSLFYLRGGTVSSSYTVTYTGNGSADFVTIGMEAWSGSRTSPLDQTNSNNTGNGVTTVGCGSITPSVVNELIFAAVGFAQAWGTAPTINNGTVTVSVNQVGSTHQGLSLAYYNDPASAAINQTWTWTSTADVAAIVASFEPGATAVNGGGGLLLLGNSVGWTPSLPGLLLPAALAVGRKAGELIRSGAKVSRRSLLGKR